ncbi:MAG: tRNA(Glu)-specific nuclease WapA [Ignavibacteria bacterium]|nr:tRNA(Glu)-specific nuclease WapA [Ignavibacteria bacterium]
MNNRNVSSQYFYGSYAKNFRNTDEFFFKYNYDMSNRLINVSNEITQDNTYHLENTYDKDGNITTLKRYGDTNTIKDNFIYAYNSGTNKLNNVNGSKDQFSYDYNGNLIDDKLNVNYDIKYDYRNLITEIYHKKGASPTRVTLYATRYFYACPPWRDDAGNRNRKLIYTNSNEFAGPVLDWNNLSNPGNGWVLFQNEFYVRGINGNELATYKDTTLVEWYVQGNGIEGKIKGTTGYYYYKDHLGSVRAVVSDNGDLVSAQDYDGWGYLLQNRSYDSDSSKYKFTGKERDKESEYDYSYARNYDSRIGIFNSSEPIPASSFGWGSYIYCADNPLRIIDPTGEEWYQMYEENGKSSW